jgi:hypothetical protein
MAKGSGKSTKGTRNRALEVLENLKDGDTVVLLQDDNGDIKGESLMEILASEETKVVRADAKPNDVLKGISDILSGQRSGKEVLDDLLVNSQVDEIASVVAESSEGKDETPVENPESQETTGDAPQESEPEAASIKDPLAELLGEGMVSALDAAFDPAAAGPTAGGKSVEDIMAELGLNVVGGDPAEINLPPRQEAAPKATAAPKQPKAPKAKSEKKESSSAPSLRIPIDAPIPAVEYRGHKIGVFGNLLEELEAPDANGYKYAELKLERFNATAHESFRNKNGRMVLLYPQGGGVYLVAAELPDGTKEPVIEVTNRGRGCLRCRQLATRFMMAYTEKKDEVMIQPTEYAELKAKVNAILVAPVAAPAPKEEPKAEGIEQETKEEVTA